MAIAALTTLGQLLTWTGGDFDIVGIPPNHTVGWLRVYSPEPAGGVVLELDLDSTFGTVTTRFGAATLSNNVAALVRGAGGKVTIVGLTAVFAVGTEVTITATSIPPAT